MSNLSPNSNTSANRLIALLKVIAQIIFLIFIYLLYIKISRLGFGEYASLGDLIEGSARRPFVYRVFLPHSASALAKILPIKIQASAFQPPFLRETFLRLSEKGYPEEAFLVLLFIFFSLAGFMYIEKKFLADLGFSKEAQLALPTLLLFLSMPFTAHFGYIYDIPQLFLFTTSLWLLYRQKWGWYLFLFLLTTLNKETSILLTLLYIFYFYPRLEKKHFIKILFWQLFIYFVLRSFLLITYRQNPGYIVYLAYLRHIEQYKTQPILLMITIFFFASIYALIRKNWKAKSPFLKTATIIPLLMILLFFIGGMPMEFRVFLETIPIVGVLMFNPEKLQKRSNV